MNSKLSTEFHRRLVSDYVDHGRRKATVILGRRQKGACYKSTPKPDVTTKSEVKAGYILAVLVLLTIKMSALVLAFQVSSSLVGQL